MKNVLIISYFFPPLGGPGVQRVTKFVKYLPEFGWNPIVLTVKNIEYIAYDETLLSEVNHAAIKRTESLDLMRLLHVYEKFRGNRKKRVYQTAGSKLRNRLRDIFPIDPKIGWLPFAVKQGIHICRTQKIDLVFATLLPYTSALAGYKIAARCKVPLVLDYRDLWQGKPDIGYFSNWHYELSEKWERRVLTASAKVLMNTKKAAATIQKLYPEIPSKRVQVLYNGFDKNDFENVSVAPERDKIYFTYTGGFYGERTPTYFIRAVRELKRENKLPLTIRFRFIGNNVQAINELLLAKDIRDVVEVISQVSHQECVKYLLNSDFLMLFIAKRKSEVVIPAKLFEYMAAQKPILAMLPLQGEAAEIIRDLQVGLLSEIDDVPMIKNHILELYNFAETGKSMHEFKFSGSKISQFERKKQTQKLAEIFHDITSQD